MRYGRKYAADENPGRRMESQDWDTFPNGIQTM